MQLYKAFVPNIHIHSLFCNFLVRLTILYLNRNTHILCSFYELVYRLWLNSFYDLPLNDNAMFTEETQSFMILPALVLFIKIGIAVGVIILYYPLAVIYFLVNILLRDIFPLGYEP